MAGASQRLETRKVQPEDLLTEEEVQSHGFAGHTINDYPEPLRSYHIAHARLKRTFQQLSAPTPLLVYVQDQLTGIIVSLWRTRVGIVPVRRVGETTLEVEEDRVIQLTGDKLTQITFSVHEVLVIVPSWAKRSGAS